MHFILAGLKDLIHLIRVFSTKCVILTHYLKAKRAYSKKRNKNPWNLRETKKSKASSWFLSKKVTVFVMQDKLWFNNWLIRASLGYFCLQSNECVWLSIWKIVSPLCLPVCKFTSGFHIYPLFPCLQCRGLFAVSYRPFSNRFRTLTQVLFLDLVVSCAKSPFSQTLSLVEMNVSVIILVKAIWFHL